MGNLSTGMKYGLSVMALGLVLGANSASAEIIDAHCDIYPDGRDLIFLGEVCGIEDKAGVLNIEVSDIYSDTLIPSATQDGMYLDREHNEVELVAGLGVEGQLFRMKDQLLFVYWDDPSKALFGGHSGHVEGWEDRGPDMWQVTGVDDILNVRSSPFIDDNIIGAMANGDMVKNLGCHKTGDQTWCKIEMLDDMHSTGWVSHHYLSR